MEESDRYAMEVGNIHQDEIDLLDCLLRIDQQKPLDPRAGQMRWRLIEAGLVDSGTNGMCLTHAGIERCRSLQHRIAGDREAAKVLAARGMALAVAASDEDSLEDQDP